MRKLLIPLLACGLLFPTLVLAQKKPLTLDVLYEPDSRVNFDGSIPMGLQWMNDGSHYLERRSDGPAPLVKVEAASGQVSPLFDPALMQEVLAGFPGIGPQDARNIVTGETLLVSPSEEGVMFTVANDLFYYAFEGRLVRATNSPGQEKEAQFSPDGRMIAFVRDYNLFVTDVDRGVERQLTVDGNARRFNGILDWVYQEEIYGRGSFRGFWWSPDSTRLAYLQLDQGNVPEYAIINHLEHPQDYEVDYYPKPGDPNPQVRLGVVSAVGSDARWVDTSAYGKTEILIVGVSWAPDASALAFQVQNRVQTWLDLNVADIAANQVATLFRETTPAWVNVLQDPLWLKDGSFLWLSERDGWKHIYRYDRGGQLRGRLTEGPWEVLQVFGADEEENWVYVTANRDSIVNTQVYRVSLNGAGMVLVSREPGTHRPSFNRPMTMLLNERSDLTTPPRLDLLKADGSMIRVVAENKVPALEEYQLADTQFLEFQTRDGFTLDALIIRPADFDPSRKYPVLCHVYGGPQAPAVRNRWGSRGALWHHYMAQQGYIVWISENRISSGRGAESAWPVHRNFGEYELRDLEDGVEWLRAQPFVDGSRIGLWGWSFGGYLTSYALTNSSSFKLGIAGGPVTDWRLYDTIYTERYMGLPQDNPEGYDRSSVLKSAERLHGKLLLIHGMIDENVHVQQTIQLMYELQKAGKPFDVMLYPNSRHGVTIPALVYHMRGLMTRFVMDNL
jgi:dipeptidyl-peptidase 4